MRCSRLLPLLALMIVSTRLPAMQEPPKTEKDAAGKEAKPKKKKDLSQPVTEEEKATAARRSERLFGPDEPLDFTLIADFKQAFKSRDTLKVKLTKASLIVKDSSGSIVELRCTYDPATRGGDAPDGRKVQGTIHWVAAPTALDCEVRLYDRLFTIPEPDSVDDYMSVLNPDSLVVVKGAKIEPSVAEAEPGTRYQFERTGYFISDTVDSKPGALVFNRTVGLRDSWAKVTAKK